jgi:autotransporter-associated beta strand protein
LPSPVAISSGSALAVSSGTLTLSGSVSSSAGTFTKTGGGTLTITGSQSHSGTMTVSAGTVNFNTNATNLAINANATTNFNSSQTLAGLSVGNGATATVAAGANKVVRTTAFSTTGTGTLDLMDNKLIVAGGVNPQATQSSLKALIIAGRNVPVGGVADGSWDGHGITSTTAHAAFVSEGFETRAIGYAVNSNLPLGAYGAFGGQSVGANDVLVRYTKLGDTDLDGKCGDNDVTVVGAFYDQGIATSLEWYDGDFNYDGRVNDDDVTILGAFYDEFAIPLSASDLTARYGAEFATAFAAGQAMSVPEPAAALLVVGAFGLGATRRRRRRG